MKLQVGLVAAALTTLLACMVHADEAAMKAVMQCAKESNIKIESLMKACNEDLTAMPGFKCLTKCVQNMMGIMDENGKWSPERATSFVADEDRDEAIKVATECSKEVDHADLCERASGANECMRKKSPEIYKKSCVALIAKMMS